MTDRTQTHMQAQLALGIGSVHSQDLPHTRVHHMQPRCVCLCAYTCRDIPPRLRLAQRSDNAGDRPRAPLLHCSHQSGMLSSEEKNTPTEELSHCVGNVIIEICAQKALAHALERPAVRAESVSWSLMGIF